MVLQFGSATLFLLAPLHFAVEGFFLGVEAGSDLEQVKTGNRGGAVIVIAALRAVTLRLR